MDYKGDQWRQLVEENKQGFGFQSLPVLGAASSVVVEKG